MKQICVYASSSEVVDRQYRKSAEELGALLGKTGFTLIYGAGCIGLMGDVARAAHKHNGHVIGVIPQKLNKPGIVYDAADELIVTKTMRERKATMETLADAFIVLPGGYGTLEEMFEIIVLRQLQYTTKPLVIMNINGMYDSLLHFLDQLVEKKFIRKQHRYLFHAVDSPVDALHYLQSYTPDVISSKLEIAP